MPLNPDDIEAIGTLLELKLEEKLQPIDQRLGILGNQVQSQIDGIYKKLETLEQEHLVISNQLDRIERKVNSHEERFTELGQQCP